MPLLQQIPSPSNDTHAPVADDDVVETRTSISASASRYGQYPGIAKGRGYVAG